jgi:copper(I)-binding protein
MRRTALLVLSAACALAGCSAPSSDSDSVEVTHAVITLPAVSGRPGAGYFTLEAPRDGIRLQRVESPRAERAELHDVGMQPIAEVILPAGEDLAFAPGGRHVMLFGLDPALQPGARIPLTFTFAGAAPVTAQAEVRAPGDVHGGHE